MTKRSIAKLLVCVMVVSLILLDNSNSYAAQIYLQGWDLVDSGKHLDYDGDSVYMSNFIVGTNKWNNYKSGVIRPDTVWIYEDVYVSDTSSSGGWKGRTFRNGYITFNTSQMSGIAVYKRTNVATHEIGHALGLGHGSYGDIMYESSSVYTKAIPLSVNDKASYNEASGMMVGTMPSL